MDSIVILTTNEMILCTLYAEELDTYTYSIYTNILLLLHTTHETPYEHLQQSNDKIMYNIKNKIIYNVYKELVGIL